MKKTTAFIFYSLLFSCVFFEVRAANDSTRWVLASSQAGRSATTIELEADEVVLPLTLTSTQSNADKRIDDLIQAAEELEDKVKGDSDIRLMEGWLDHASGAVGLPNLTFGEKQEDDEVSNPGQASSITLHLIVSPRFKSSDLLERAEALAKFADKLTMGAVGVQIGKIQLAVANPEQYRSELLKNILEEMNGLRELAGSNTILHVSGLSDPIQVRQMDHQRAELFINYTLTLEQWGAKDPASFPDR